MSNAITTLGQSYQQPTKWQIAFPRVANTIFYCTEVSVPGFTINEAKQATPRQDLYVPGTKVNFEPLAITFLIDEEFNAWYDIYNWMTGLGSPNDPSQYANLAANSVKGGVKTFGVRPPYADGTLNLFTAKNNISLIFNFQDCYPFSLSAVRMSYGQSADTVITAVAQFRYTQYTFARTS